MTVLERILALKLLKKQDGKPEEDRGHIVQIKMIKRESETAAGSLLCTLPEDAAGLVPETERSRSNE